MDGPSVSEIFETLDYGPAPEDDAPFRAWQDKLPADRHWIGGKWVASRDGLGAYERRDPASGEVLTTCALGGSKDVEAAVKAARKAQKGWVALGGAGRARHLYALARMVQRHSRLFALADSFDSGKPIRESRDIDIPLVARHFYHHAGWAQLLEREFPNTRPWGVVGQIIPWNFPLLMLAWKVAPALAAGNTVVLKPAEDTSLGARAFAELAGQTGLPPGVLNVVTGDGGAGRLIVDQEGIDKVAFTGSTEVGKQIRIATAGTGKGLTLELGGKSPFIVFEDADLDSAVEGVVDAIWFNQGEVCCAGSRLLVQEGVQSTFLDKLKVRMEALRIGDPRDKTIDMGVLISPDHRKRVSGLVEEAVAAGAACWQPGWWQGSGKAKSCAFPPTLITDVSPSDRIAQTEVFGPVLTAMSFRTPAEAVSLANNTPYGLAASVWSESLNLALDIAPKLKAGIVWVNCTNQMDAACGFGGYRESGFGREGGREGMWAYLRTPLDFAPDGSAKKKALVSAKAPGASEGIDRTAKHYIGGKQARPDGGRSLAIHGADGRYLADVAEGNRKDIRNAVEAAAKAGGWASASTHNRAQILYYIAENLDARRDEFASRLRAMTGVSAAAAKAEVEASIDRLFDYGAWADKFDGAVHSPPMRNVTLAMNEPVGVMALVCSDESPLLSFISLLAPAMVMGNRVVIIPSETAPLAATDFYQVLETSDVPGGVVNIVTGKREGLALDLARHDGVDGIWYCGSADGAKRVEQESAANLKQSWVDHGCPRDWADRTIGAGPGYLRRATQVKNIWIPYGE